MNDPEAYKLLELLAQYGAEYTPDVPLTVPALAEDLVDSMNQDFRSGALEHLGVIRRTWGKY